MAGFVDTHCDDVPIYGPHGAAANRIANAKVVRTSGAAGASCPTP
jgi:hypothetical protein